MTTFQDILKNSFLEGFQSDISTIKICVTLLLATLLGAYIFFVYRYKTKSAFYSKDFNNTLLLLPVITSGIVLAMQSSIVISLGMVGALSIVRFRNAVKSSLDLAFLFWSISVGIIIGAGVYEIGVILSLVVTVLLFAADFVPVKEPPYLLALHGEDIDFDGEILPVLKASTHSYKVKSRSQAGNRCDMIIEIRSDKESEIIAQLSANAKIRNVNILAHDGEVRF